MSKGVRIYDLARQLEVPSRELLDMLKKKGVDAKSHMSTVDDATADMILNSFKDRKKSRSGAQQQQSEQEKTEKLRLRRMQPRQRQKRRPSFRKPPESQQQPTQKPPRQTEKPAVEHSKAEAKEKQESTLSSSQKHRRSRMSRKRRDRAKKAASLQARKTETTQPSQQRESTPEQEPSREKKEKPSGRPARSGAQRPQKAKSDTPESERRDKKKRRDRSRSTSRNRPRKDTRTTDKEKASQGGGKTTSRQKPSDTKDETNARRRSRTRKPSPSPTTTKAPQEKQAKSPSRKPRKKVEKPVTPPPVEVEQGPKPLLLPEVIMVKELAEKMDVPSAKIIRHLMTMGIMANVNQVLEPEAAKSIAENFGFEVKAVSEEDELEQQEEVIDESKLKPRPPVVTIMGHVDHGKTTLLDAIRESKIIDSEFGGITQHIGAYAVEVNTQKIVFLDTPGHEAFTSMRARGAQVTDEVILVVAADDGIMPQTIEAIDHAKAAEVPIIVAINKIDMPGANPDRVMQEMTKYGLTPEEWGGDTICVRVSAKERDNLDELLEMIILQAEMLELKADPDRSARGVIVESLLDKGRGPVATVLVQSGTLRIGDPFVVGSYHGKVRAMLDDRGRRVQEVGPATPVEVLGLTGVPVAGDSFVVVENERKARQIAEKRQQEQQKIEFSKTPRITLEELHHHIKEGETQELRIVIKADVHGSVEALTEALERLSTEKVRLQVIHGGVGAINESDVMLAMASGAIVLGFNVRPVVKAKEMAEKEHIDVRLYTVIYQAIDDVKKAMEGLLEPVYREVLSGEARVQALFSLPKLGNIAGCRVTSGKISRNSIARLLRNGKEVYKGNIASLRRVKDDVREVVAGYECGIRLENFNDLEVGDVIEAYELERVAMTLEGPAK